MRRTLLLVLLVLLAAVTPLLACTSEDGVATDGSVSARVLVTRDFGAEVLIDELLTLEEGVTCMKALKQVGDIGTAYGGGFVQSINGIESGKPAKLDWFFFINGIMSNRGALDYTLHDGDVMQWDFHNWTFHTFVPATVGAFPTALLHGFNGKTRPTVVAYEPDLADCAEALAESLEQLGIEVAFLGDFTELAQSEKESSNVVVVGTFDCDMVTDLNDKWDKLGFFVHFQDGVMTAYDSTGETIGEYGAGSGVIQATQNPWNPKGTGVCENVAVMLSGTDEAGVRGVVDALIDDPNAPGYACAAVVVGGTAIRVPEQ